ncbi:MAG TPA: ubiquitin carboxyl-terminal hydrolase family protein [Amoebophilaceae bacterium]|nr:ubiquitin carboxyl-terminal hydrolase family protein [Amoebophilaceae bacterium]
MISKLFAYLPVVAVGSLILGGCHARSRDVPKKEPVGLKDGRGTDAGTKQMPTQEKQPQQPTTKAVALAPTTPSQSSDSGYSSDSSSSSRSSGSSRSNAFMHNNSLVTQQKTDAIAPAGLPNMGNTCFMNASLQVIAALYADKISPFPDDFKNVIEAINGQYQAVDTELVNKFRESLLGKGSLGKLAKDGKQECAAEFLILLNQIHQVSSSDTSNLFLENWRTITTTVKKTNEVNSGATTSDVMCPLLPVLFADIKDNKFLESFLFQDDTVDDKKNITARNTTCCCSGDSKTLAIQLNRYTYTNGVQNKLEDGVNVPATVQIPKSSASNAPKRRFELSGFIVHSGANPNSGHYYAYVKKHSTWYCANDLTISKVDESEAMQKAKLAYILFYVCNE